MFRKSLRLSFASSRYLMLLPTTPMKKSLMFFENCRNPIVFEKFGKAIMKKNFKKAVPSLPKTSLKIVKSRSFSWLRVLASMPNATELMMSTVKRFPTSFMLIEGFSAILSLMAATRLSPLLIMIGYMALSLPEVKAGLSLLRR